MAETEKIIIEKVDNGFTVTQGEKYADAVGFDEMLGLIAALTMPERRPCIQWMRTKEHHEAIRQSYSK